MQTKVTKTKVLIDILKIKHEKLQQIADITENQECLFSSGTLNQEVSILFHGLTKEKQKCIDEIVQMDKMFEKTFDEVNDDFEAFAMEQKPLIEELQQMIKKVMDLDIKIRVLEQKNREKASMLTRKAKPPKLNISKQKLLNQYQQNKMFTNKKEVH